MYLSNLNTVCGRPQRLFHICSIFWTNFTKTIHRMKWKTITLFFIFFHKNLIIYKILHHKIYFAKQQKRICLSWLLYCIHVYYTLFDVTCNRRCYSIVLSLWQFDYFSFCFCFCWFVHINIKYSVSRMIFDLFVARVCVRMYAYVWTCGV